MHNHIELVINGITLHISGATNVSLSGPANRRTVGSTQRTGLVTAMPFVSTQVGPTGPTPAPAFVIPTAPTAGPVAATGDDEEPLLPTLLQIKVTYGSQLGRITLDQQHRAISRFLELYSGDCIYHHLIRSTSPQQPHSSIEQCEADFREGSLYRESWRHHIKFRVKGLCYVCGGCGAFEHNNRWGKICDNDPLLVTLRAIGFIVLNSPELRDLVFKVINVDPALFLEDQILYAIWLGYPGSFNRRGSANLIDVLYTVAILHERGALPLVDATFVAPPEAAFLA